MSFLLKEDSDFLLLETGGKIILEKTSTIDDTDTIKTYRFQSEFILDAIDTIKDLSPANWYWYVGADNLIHFHAKPVIATHAFVFGKHFKKIDVFKNMEQVKNSYLFRGGDPEAGFLHKNYIDSNSITDYDRRCTKKVDSRVTVQATANSWAAAFLEERKDPIVKTIVEILDNNYDEINGYDIESIEPGDTCKFININVITSKTFSNNMIIRKVDYKPEKVILEIETVALDLATQIFLIHKRLSRRTETNIPPFYIE